MPLKLLADESLDFRIVLNLKEAGFEIISVLKDYQGVSDAIPHKDILEGRFTIDVFAATPSICTPLHHRPRTFLICNNQPLLQAFLIRLSLHGISEMPCQQ